MIDYIKNNAYGSVVYQMNDDEQLEVSNLSYIKRLCIKALFTYPGYLKAVQTKFHFSYKIPLYIDDGHMFIPTSRTRDYANIWINYAAIQTIQVGKDQLAIFFHSGNILFIKNSFISFRKQIKQLEQIRMEKVKHFHS